MWYSGSLKPISPTNLESVMQLINLRNVEKCLKKLQMWLILLVPHDFSDKTNTFEQSWNSSILVLLALFGALVDGISLHPSTPFSGAFGSLSCWRTHDLWPRDYFLTVHYALKWYAIPLNSFFHALVQVTQLQRQQSILITSLNFFHVLLWVWDCSPCTPLAFYWKHTVAVIYRNAPV